MPITLAPDRLSGMESAALSPPENRPDAAAGADACAAETADTRPASTIYGSLRGRALRLELSRLAGQIRPSWRGWIHTGAFLSLIHI